MTQVGPDTVHSREEMVALAHELADRSASVILPLFRGPTVVENKGGWKGYDPVTIADRAGERVICEHLERHFPHHGMIGEELGARGADSRYTWVVDPIDGTRAFILGLPVWGTLIGLLEHGEPAIGLMNQPFTRERFWSDGARSCFRGPDGVTRPIVTRNCARMADAALMTTSPHLFQAGPESTAFARLRKQARLTRYGGDCYAYCLLAAGHVDVVLEAGLEAYDIVALIPIIEAAGGCVTSWDGGPAKAGGRILACGDKALHDKIVAQLVRNMRGADGAG